MRDDTNEVLRHITLGVNEVLYFPYNNGTEPLPVRPLSSLELDECYLSALKEAPPKVAELVVKLKTGILDEETEVDLSNDGYVNLKKFYSAIHYYIVYHGMKDFQDEWFRKPDFQKGEPKGMETVRQMDDIHRIAKYILSASTAHKKVIEEVYKTSRGKHLATKIVYLNEQLCDLKDMTELQEKYIVHSKGHIDEYLEGVHKEKSIIKSGETMKLRDLLRAL